MVITRRSLNQEAASRTRHERCEPPLLAELGDYPSKRLLPRWDEGRWGCHVAGFTTLAGLKRRTLTWVRLLPTNGWGVSSSCYQPW